MVTIAPELTGAKEVIGELSERGIVVSVGKSFCNVRCDATVLNIKGLEIIVLCHI